MVTTDENRANWCATESARLRSQRTALRRPAPAGPPVFLLIRPQKPAFAKMGGEHPQAHLKQFCHARRLLCRVQRTASDGGIIEAGSWAHPWTAPRAQGNF